MRIFDFTGRRFKALTLTIAALLIGGCGSDGSNQPQAPQFRSIAYGQIEGIHRAGLPHLNSLTIRDLREGL